MKNITLTLLIFVFFIELSCNKKYETGLDKQVIKYVKPKQLVDDQTIYEFLNYNFEHKDPAFFDCENIINQEWYPCFFTHEDSLALIKMDTIFTKADTDFIFRQAEYVQYFNLNQTLLPNKNIIKIDTTKAYNNDREIRGVYYEELYKKHGPLCTIKMPLFSVDRKTVYISTGLTCGTLCGAGATYIYRKVNGKWILIKTLNEWVS